MRTPRKRWIYEVWETPWATYQDDFLSTKADKGEEKLVAQFPSEKKALAFIMDSSRLSKICEFKIKKKPFSK
jgi:hypothetical protein